MDYTKFVKDENGSDVSYSAAVMLMDDDIRERLHYELAPCDEQTFFNAYLVAHKEKYGFEFVV